mgnify:CR=1 FL=1
MERTIRESLEGVTATELKLDALRRFRRREMLRIGVRDLLRLADVVETTGSLSDLASVLIDAAYRIVDHDLRARHGIPMHQNRQRRWWKQASPSLRWGSWADTNSITAPT